MIVEDSIPDDVRDFAQETGAEKVEYMSANETGIRLHYDSHTSEIIHVGELSDVPEGYQANLTFAGTPCIDFFPW